MPAVAKKSDTRTYVYPTLIVQWPTIKSRVTPLPTGKLPSLPFPLGCNGNGGGNLPRRHLSFARRCCLDNAGSSSLWLRVWRRLLLDYPCLRRRRGS